MNERYSASEVSSNFQIEKEKIERLGIKPGVYVYSASGDEYLTLDTAYQMTLDKDGSEIVGDEEVLYVGLYLHPHYGPYAKWTSSPERFKSQVEIDGEVKPRFEWVRAEP